MKLSDAWDRAINSAAIHNIPFERRIVFCQEAVRNLYCEFQGTDRERGKAKQEVKKKIRQWTRKRRPPWKRR